MHQPTTTKSTGPWRRLTSLLRSDASPKPTTAKEMTAEVAGPTTSVRVTQYDSIANTLTPERLASILMAVDSNDALEYLTLAEEIEEREFHYASVLGTRKHAVKKLPVMVEAALDDDKNAKEQADFIRQIVEDDTFRDCLFRLLDGLGKGFSVCEIMWERTADRWFPTDYVWRDPRHFQFDQLTRRQLRLRDETNMVEGIELQPYKFIVHKPELKTGLPIRCGLARFGVVSYMCKSFTLRDWLTFAEVFGMPIRVGKHPASATADQKAALLRAVTSIGTDAACIIPDSTMIEFLAASQAAGGDKIFSGLANWLDSQVSKCVLGQTMTTDAQPSGLGSTQADVHNEVRGDIRDSDADQLSACIRRQLVKPLIDLNFGVPADRLYPKFRLVIDRPEDLEMLSRSLPPFIDRGLKVQASVILDKFNIAEADPGAELLVPQTQATPGMQLPTQPQPGEQPAGLARAELAAAGSHQDEIDRLANQAAGDWRPQMDPILQPLLDHAKASADYKGFVAGLDGVLAKMDSTQLAQRVAVATFKARVLGDSTDKL